jgi:hypothetical protein
MKAKHFLVAERPRLAAITEHSNIAFAEYEHELRSMQSTMQAIQQAYLGTRERERWLSSKDGTPQARVESFGDSPRLWIHEASTSIRSRRRCRTSRVSTTFSVFGPTAAKS